MIRQLIRQLIRSASLLLESLLVSWLACAASVVVSLVAVNVLRRLLPAGLLPAAVSGVWGVDWAVFGGSLGVSAVVVAVGGALPFLRALRLDAAEALRDWR
ncbi:MAG TPA: hypothetical protein VFJ94_07260 [Intrasporangium sp.]|uniref:hypothetical protein n=1 Tax=Intrasporangium sp. TaxID=1925024 RepID=UPI002D76C325|nr:hypothetical protein [Intrasporangium sp.]HET7398305.1 hypothetical protein [Intrasporangium sp.]